MQTFNSEMASHVHGGGFWSFFQFDSGTSNGARADGNALGAGCGTVKSDAYVPDMLFGIDISQACVQHDQSYSMCGFNRDTADTKLATNILSECASQGGGPITCHAISSIYYVSVSLLGESAYQKAQSESCMIGS